MKMAQKVLIFMIFILLSCQNNQEKEEESALEIRKIVQKQKEDSIKKILRAKNISANRLGRHYLYFICDNDKVILVTQDIIRKEFSTFLVENINCSTSNLMHNNNPVGIILRKKLTLRHIILEAGNSQYTYIFEKAMLGKKIIEIPKETITPSILEKITNMGNGKRLSFQSIYLNKIQSTEIKNLLLD